MSSSTGETFRGLNPPPPRVNGWWLLAWGGFQSGFDSLLAEVRRIRTRDPRDYLAHPLTKLLATILRLISEDIPRDPGHKDFRQGGTLGADFTSWQRAKFHQRFRLFFRYDSRLKVIVYAWVNTQTGLRKSGDRNDPYAVFRRMLTRGSPPTNIEELIAECRALQVPQTLRDGTEAQ